MKDNAMDMAALGMPVMDADEEKAREAASDADIEMDNMAAEVAPTGKYSIRSLTVLVDAINKIIPLFDATLPLIEIPAEDIAGALPVEIVKAITMINAAVSDAMLSAELLPSLDNLVDDRALEMVAGKLILLAKNRDFLMHLKSAPKTAPEAEEIVIEKGVEAPDIDALFASRLT